MKTIISIIVVSVIFPLLVFAEADNNKDFGIVMDVSKNVSIERSRITISAEFGLNVVLKDVITLDSNEYIIIVSYTDCKEWVLKGPDCLEVRGDGVLISETRDICPSRQLPLCYRPEKFSVGTADLIGGTVWRGDSLALLQEEFKTGKALNSTLVTLIMHSLEEEDMKQAKKYFEVLKVRFPDSEFIKKVLSREFENNDRD
jgi:hypothetical protein